MNTNTTLFFEAKTFKAFTRLLTLFALLLTVHTSWGQQVIGEFPDFNGGFESFTVGTLGSNTTGLTSGTQYSAYSLSHTSSNSGSITTTTSRTGTKILTWGTSGTGRKLYSTTVNTNGGVANATAYTVQFYYQTSKSNALSSVPTIAISPDGSGAVGTPAGSTIASSLGTWVFKQISVTSGTSAAATKYGSIVFAADNFSNTNIIYFDDMCVYAGAADNIAPTAASGASTSVVSGTSLAVNWTGTQYASDGGGYVIVRSTSATVVTLNANGIYAVGNTTATGGGTIVGITTGIAGTSQSFTDTGLTTGTTYYYSIFAVDKAFNYAAAATCSGTPYAGLTPPTLTPDTTLNTVDYNLDITFTDDVTWRGLVTAVKIGGTTLTAGTDYVLTAGNLQLKPSGLNVLLTTSGSKAVTLEATGYAPAPCTQIINPGVPVAANCSTSISPVLASGTTSTITITARDQYNNLVSGYNFIYDAAITNNDATTSESYIIDGTPRTSTINDFFVTVPTNSSGVGAFTVTLPSYIDSNDGISIQVQVADGITNVGSAYSYIELLHQTITFGALTAVTYGDANFNLTATASSGLTITYTSSNPAVATVSGNTVTVVAPGTTTITAYQTGNGTYSAATPVPQTLTVSTKSLTVSPATANNKVYNGNTAATITGTLVGIINADVVTLNGTGMFATANVGTGIVVNSTSTLGGANAAKYNLVQPIGLTADITKANQAILFHGPLLNYVGFANYTPPATSPSSGTNPISFTSSNTNVATIVGTQVHYIGLGTTTITASQAASTNYNAASVSVALTVMAMPIAAWNFWTSGSVTQTNIQAYLYDTGLDSTTNNTGLPGTNTSATLAPKYITRGSGVAASGGTSAFRTFNFPNNAPANPPVTAGSNDYFQVTLQAASAGSTVSLSTIDAYFYDSGNGFNASPGTISRFGYSLDGGTTIVPIASAVQSTSLRMGQIDVSGITALQDVPFGTKIILRYYASGYAAEGWGFGSPNPGGGVGIQATDGLVIGGDVSASTTWYWNGSAFVWSNGVPSSIKNAIILAPFDTSSDTGGGFTAKKLTINSGGSLTIKAGTTITVQNQLINNAGSSAIIIENNGSLVQVNDAIPSPNSGVINYNRQTTPISNMDYTYWSSPVQGFTLGGVSPNTLADKFYSFNSVTQNWSQETTSTIMNPGTGYIIRGPQLSAYMSPNPPSTYQATFVGVPNNGKYQLSGIVANKLYLIGNPYASALDADTFIDANQDVLNGTLYFWTHNTPIANNVYTSNDYASYNRTGGVSTAAVALNSGVSSSAPSGKIASGQGFFVNSKNPALTNGDTTIDFSNAMRVGVGGITGNNSQFFRTTNTIERNRIWLDLTNTQGVFKQTLIGYVTGATNELDNLFDGESLNANQYVNFYSINQDKNLGIQGRALPFDESDIVPLGFKTTITSPLTISISNVDGLFVNQDVFLEDIVTGITTNLKTDSYTFNAEPGIYNNRFVLRYTTNALGINNPDLDLNNVIVYKNDGIVNINSGNLTMNNVKVYDLQGRLIVEQKDVNASTTSIKNLKANQQVLIVKITTQDNKILSKKFVN
ncbi:hemoblobin-interacting domain-containing protein [Flavobacterium capsici]|uniref:YDG domain-containing protein n=1 Tax=Flavobacterium capsici TaxID=3075618 RepID=A0AA96EZM7_9FLAO|nr:MULTISPECIES: YDG domain-containing protein [unclassified Flavobacterium]WNM18425.1 YDG domain-containing protein [Flavobacterium sp. PMR2A8]WNM22476.1 YDG domain-containing protein [Flavobacterium sp. PMTSA4]